MRRIRQTSSNGIRETDLLSKKRFKRSILLAACAPGAFVRLNVTTIFGDRLFHQIVFSDVWTSGRERERGRRRWPICGCVYFNLSSGTWTRCCHRYVGNKTEWAKFAIRLSIYLIWTAETWEHARAGHLLACHTPSTHTHTHYIYNTLALMKT